MAFSSCLNQDGSPNHFKTFDKERNLTLEVQINDAGKFIILTENTNIPIKMEMSRDGMDIYVCLPKDGDRLRPLITDGLVFLGYGEPFFLEYPEED